MRRILLLAATTGYQTRAFGEAARSVGAELVFATDRCHLLEDPWQDHAVPIRFHDEAESVAAILEAARERPLDGIVAVGDRPTVIAARVAEQLGLPGHAPEAVAIACDKQRTRERLREAGLLVPWFVPLRVDSDPRQILSSTSFPCVVKPVALSASRGVMRADDPDSLLASIERLRDLLAAPDVRAERNPAHDRILIEGFIPGHEVAVEGLLDRGQLKVLALFDKPDPLDGPFFEETIYVTPSRMAAEIQRGIVEAVARAAEAIGLRHGPIHAECRINQRGVFVLEVAARPIGGLCAGALRLQIEGQQRLLPFEELLLRHAAGEPIDMYRREPSASGVMMIPVPERGVYREVAGLEAARAVPGVDGITITAKVDQLLVPLPEGASYFGFVFAHGGTPDRAERSLRAAHACLRFTIEPELRVIRSGQMRYTVRHG